ncbi:hypothetical protein ACIPSA_09925 [Streptomyces sp. NPDC086549]|uniref:hypothetical protein n=1 Tax=Streptomyces sp. NPDC086549 TaxID=3365752 RepID=UPI0038295E7B
MSRTAAGRRALQLALLVGGLLALGFLCGEQAHAAEGAPSVTSVASVPSVSADAVRAAPRKVPTKSVVGAVTAPAAAAAAAAPAPVAAPVEHAGRRAAAAVAPVDREAVGSVPRRVVRPVGDLVGTVTKELGEARTKLPSLPALPQLPGLPGVSELPGRLLPAPVTPEPGTKRPGVAGSSAGDGIRGATARTAEPTTTTGAYGPDRTAAAPAPGPAAHADGHRAAPPVNAPSHPAPPGDQGGAPGRPAVGNDSPRHGDAHAVTPNHRAPLRLAPGTAARVDAAGTRDRHRDIPVFPG